MAATFSTPKHDHDALKNLFSTVPLAGHGVPLHQAYGFTLSVVSAPDLIQPSEYLPMLFTSETVPELDSREEAEQVMSGLLSIWTFWADQLRGKLRFTLPAECTLDSRGRPRPALVDFCTGYLLGSDWLQASWDGALADYAEDSEESGFLATAMVLCLALCRPDALKQEASVFVGQGKPLTPAAAMERLPRALMDVAQIGMRFHRQKLRKASSGKPA